MWAENWGWVHGDSLAKDYPKALERAKKYINRHAELAAQLGKPLVLEEFGFPRDGGSCEPASATTFRDRYFQEVYALVYSLIPTTPMAGIMPGPGLAPRGRRGRATFGGQAIRSSAIRPQKQGWYSIYDKDTTLKLIADWSSKITETATGPTASAPTKA